MACTCRMLPWPKLDQSSPGRVTCACRMLPGPNLELTMEGCTRLEVLDAQHSEVPTGAGARLHEACPALRMLLQTAPPPQPPPPRPILGQPRAIGVRQHLLLVLGRHPSCVERSLFGRGWTIDHLQSQDGPDQTACAIALSGSCAHVEWPRNTSMPYMPYECQIRGALLHARCCGARGLCASSHAASESDVSAGERSTRPSRIVILLYL